MLTSTIPKIHNLIAVKLREARIMAVEAVITGISLPTA
jgi:hypothetical protein